MIVLLAGNTTWSMYNFRRGLILHLQQAGHEVHVASPRDDFTERLAALGCTVHDVAVDSKGRSPLRDLRLVRDYVRLLRAVRPALMINYTIKPVIYGALAARHCGVPCLSLVTGLGSAFAGRRSLVIDVLYRLSQRHASTVFFLNREDRDVLVGRGLVGRDAAALLPGEGIDLDHFAPQPDTPATATDDGTTTFLMAGRMLWEKGVGVFVDAFRLLRTAHPSLRFQLLGPCGTASVSAISREQMAAWEREGIEYLGTAADVRPWVAAADCIVLPSHYREGVPRILLEAAALGRAAVTTDTPGCRDAVTDGVTGFLCRPQDPQNLADVLLRYAALDAPARQAMGANARRKMATEFDQRLVLAAYDAAIARATGVRAGPVVA